MSRIVLRLTGGSKGFPGSPRQPQKCSSADAAAALLAGAHDLTVAPQILMEMVTDSLTEEAVERFTQDWQMMNKL